MSHQIQTEAFSKHTLAISIGDVPLASELNKITKFRNSEAPEIIAFYAGRIIEAMVSIAVSNFKLPIGDGKVSTILDILSKHGKIDEGTLSIAHAIRRYGNQARHLERAIHGEEENTIIGLLQLWVEWFEQAVYPNSMHTLGSISCEWSDKTVLLKQLAYPQSGALDEYLQQPEQREALLTEAAIAEFAAERLVDFRSQFADAFTAEVMTRFPRSIRGKQMRALYFSRNGNPEGAINILSKFLNYKTIDRETFGILGGAFKNKWIKTNLPEELENAHRYYQKGADTFPKDYYLRINLAATSLWKGDAPESRTHAHVAIQSLADYGFVINTGDNCEGIDYWVVATIAEANLLAGKAKRAVYLYEQARNMDASGGRWNRTLQQLSLHLKFIEDQNTRQNFTALTTL